MCRRGKENFPLFELLGKVFDSTQFRDYRCNIPGSSHQRFFLQFLKQPSKEGLQYNFVPLLLKCDL